MPFIRTNVPHHLSAQARHSIVQGIHDALVGSIGMPVDELFNMVANYQPGDFACSRTFNGVARSEDVVVVIRSHGKFHQGATMLQKTVEMANPQKARLITSRRRAPSSPSRRYAASAAAVRSP